MTDARQLVVIRHAKAGPHEGIDFDRELTPQGYRDAVAAGEWLADRRIEPDLALVSAAFRTRQTWAGIASGARWRLEASEERSLYAAEPYDVLQLVSLVEESVGTVIVVGHNPTMHAFAAGLDDGRSTAAAAAEMASGFPTCAMAVFAVGARWADLAERGGRLTDFHVGRG